MGLRDRQSAGLRAHRHRRRGQLHRPQAVRPEPRQLHPDRCGDQLRQQRRAADQLARPGDRHQLRGQPAGEQHRLRGADQPGARGAAAVEEARPRRARLHRRHAARRRSRSAGVAEAGARRRRAGAGRHAGFARRARRPAALRRDRLGGRPAGADAGSPDSPDRRARSRAAPRKLEYVRDGRTHVGVDQARRAAAPAGRSRHDHRRTIDAAHRSGRAGPEPDRDRRQQRASLRHSRPA